jgi:hypothetical protein
MRLNTLFSATLAALLCASSAGAQVLELPSRPYRGLFGGGPPPNPNRVRQELTLGGNVLGGYDDSLAPPGGGSLLTPNPSGYVGFSEAHLKYLLGRAGRSIELTGRGFMNTYRNIGVNPTYGGDQLMRASIDLGRRTSVALDESYGFSPMFTLGVFAPVAGGGSGNNPDANQTNGIADDGLWSTNVTGTLSHAWTRKMRTSVSYSLSKQDYVGGLGFDGVTHGGRVSFERSLSRSWAVRAFYSHSDGTFTEKDDDTIPLLTDTGEVGLSYQRRLSRTRTIAVSGTGGVVNAQTIDALTHAPFTFSGPSASGAVRLDFHRSWNISADYRQTVALPAGVSVQPYLTTAATVGVGGFVNRWLETVGNVGYSTGAASVVTISREQGQFDAYNGTAQVRLRLSRFWSALISGTHYQYVLNEAATESLLVRPLMKRNAVRVGISWAAPLLGSYIGSPLTADKD